jgi:predicted transcriptional regulator
MKEDQGQRVYHEEEFTKGRLSMAHWTFLTNHAQVLLFIAYHRQVTTRHIAAAVGITERAVLQIVRELEETGYIRRFHEGRTNRYEVDLSKPLRHPAQRGQPIRELVTLLERYLAVPEKDEPPGSP